MKNLYIIKIGGDTLNHETSLKSCIQAIADSGEKVILVHGGGKKVTELASKLGIEQEMIDGRRITSTETLDLCTMVYAGLINKNMVAEFFKKEKKAAGLSGADFNCILSEKRNHPTIDYGQVGDVQQVDAEIFSDFVEKNIVPVVCSITLSFKGELLNTNADTMASEIAKAMTEKYHVHLIYCFEKNGVLTDVNDEYSVLKTISEPEFETMKETKQIADGMIPKLFTAFQVLHHGAQEVRIMNSQNLAQLFSHEKPGTEILV